MKYLHVFAASLCLFSACLPGFNLSTSNPMGRKTLISYQDRENKQYPQILVPGLELKVIAGNGEADYKDGPALEASFNRPASLAQDNKGNLYINDDQNHRIRLLSTQGQVSSLVGTGKSPTELQHSIGSFNEIKFVSTGRVSFWEKDKLIISWGSNYFQLDLTTQVAEEFLRPEKLVQDAVIEIPKLPFTVDNHFNFTGSVSHKGSLYLLANLLIKVDKTDKGYRWQYVADGQPWIQSLLSSPDPYEGTRPTSPDYAFVDGKLSDALFFIMVDLSFDQDDNMYIADMGNQRIRKVNAQTQQVTTVSGKSFLGFDDGFNYRPPLVGGFKDGAFQDALFNDPFALEVLNTDELLVCDHNKALRYLVNGQVKTLIRNIQCDLLKDKNQILISDSLHHRIYSLDIQSLRALQPVILKQSNIDEKIDASHP